MLVELNSLCFLNTNLLLTIFHLPSSDSLIQNFSLSLIGVIHGLTNLGGSLLTILSSVINKDDKFKTRYCIAYGYLIMGVIQLLVIFFFFNPNIKNSRFEKGYLLH